MSEYQQPSRNVAVPILFGINIALIAGFVYLFLQLDSMKVELTRQREAVSTEIGSLREASTVTTATNKRTVESLREQLAAAQREQQQAVGQAKVEAQRHAEELARKLEAEQKRQTQQVASEIKSEIKEVAAAATTRIGEVSSEVSSVRSEVTAAKSEIDKTIAELKSVRGDLGVQSGLIATNSKELAALRALGERNYFEFKLGRTKAPQRVGDIALLLKRADQKRNRFTIELVADDKKVEKKDRNINEPLQFYVSKARQPYELVINSVGKDEISGYLATPKVQAGRTN